MAQEEADVFSPTVKRSVESSPSETRAVKTAHHVVIEFEVLVTSTRLYTVSINVEYYVATSELS